MSGGRRWRWSGALTATVTGIILIPVPTVWTGESKLLVIKDLAHLPDVTGSTQVGHVLGSGDSVPAAPSVNSPAACLCTLELGTKRVVSPPSFPLPGLPGDTGTIPRWPSFPSFNSGARGVEPLSSGWGPEGPFERE